MMAYTQFMLLENLVICVYGEQERVVSSDVQGCKVGGCNGKPYKKLQSPQQSAEPSKGAVSLL